VKDLVLSTVPALQTHWPDEVATKFLRVLQVHSPFLLMRVL
jgi:hypothetical protein